MKESMSKVEALELLEAPFVTHEAITQAEALADACMTKNQKALLAQFVHAPFGFRIRYERDFRKAILRRAIAAEVV